MSAAREPRGSHEGEEQGPRRWELGMCFLHLDLGFPFNAFQRLKYRHLLHIHSGAEMWETAGAARTDLGGTINRVHTTVANFSLHAKIRQKELP